MTATVRARRGQPWARATARRPATRASLTIRAVLARTEAPSGQVRDPGEQPRRQGRPADARRLGLARWPRSIASRASAAGSASAAGTGTQTSTPAPSPSPRCAPPGPPRRPTSGTRPRRPDPEPSGRRSRAARPGRPRRPARRASRGTRASPGRRGSPWGRRRRRRPASGRAPRGRRDVELGGRRLSARGGRGARDGRRRSRRSRRPGSRPRGRRSSWPRPSWPPSRRRSAPPARLGRAALRTPRPAPWRAPRGRRRRGPTRIRPSRIATVAGTAPALADGGLRRPRHLEVLGVRQAVADQRRLEGDDGAARGERGGDLRGDVESGAQRGEAGIVGHGGSVARCGPRPSRRRLPCRCDCPSRRPDRPPAALSAARSWSRSSTCRPTGRRGRRPSLRPRRDVPLAPRPGLVRIGPATSRAGPRHGPPARPAPRLQPHPDRGRRPRHVPPHLARRPARRVRAQRSPDDPERPTAVIGAGARRRRAVGPVRRREHGVVGEVAWSPDGRRLAFTAWPPRSDAPRFTRRATEAQGPTSRAPRRRITRADWRWDGVGHRDRWSHLFVVDATGARCRARSPPATGASRTSPGPPTVDRSPSPPTRVRAPTSGSRPSIWAVDVDGGAGAAPSRASVLAAGLRGSPGLLARRPLARGDRRRSTPDPLDDDQPDDPGRPGRRVGRARGARPGPRPAGRQLDRHRPERLDGVGRPGPFWRGAGRDRRRS